MTKPKPKIIKITIELGEMDYNKYFEIPKSIYREKTGKYRSNSDTFLDHMAEKEHYQIINEQKSQRIEQQYSENLELKKDTKEYVESLKFKCEKCGNEGMSQKLDYAAMYGWKENVDK